MDNLNYNYKRNTSKVNNSPDNLDFSSYFFENILPTNRQYHGYSSLPQIEKEYQQMLEEKSFKRGKSLIHLTSEKLKKESSEIYSYYNNCLRNIFIFSFLLIIDKLIEIKNFGPTDISIALIIMGSISAAFCFILLINIRNKVLLDPFEYVAFYLFSMIIWLILIFVLIFQFINLIKVIRGLYVSNNDTRTNSDYEQLGSFVYLFILLFNVAIIIFIVFCIKYTHKLFLDGFNILILKEKAIFQKQIDLNEKKSKGK